MKILAILLAFYFAMIPTCSSEVDEYYKETNNLRNKMEFKMPKYEIVKCGTKRVSKKYNSIACFNFGKKYKIDITDEDSNKVQKPKSNVKTRGNKALNYNREDVGIKEKQRRTKMKIMNIIINKTQTIRKPGEEFDKLAITNLISKTNRTKREWRSRNYEVGYGNHEDFYNNGANADYGRFLQKMGKDRSRSNRYSLRSHRFREPTRTNFNTAEDGIKKNAGMEIHNKFIKNDLLQNKDGQNSNCTCREQQENDKEKLEKYASNHKVLLKENLSSLHEEDNDSKEKSESVEMERSTVASKIKLNTIRLVAPKKDVEFRKFENLTTDEANNATFVNITKTTTLL